MTLKSMLLGLGALVLMGAGLFFFTDWFAAPDIQIIHSMRPNPQRERQARRRDRPPPSSHVVSFSLNRRLTLKSIRVIPAADAATNKYPHPLWHFISDSNSVPTKSFVYGQFIRGMRPSVPGAWADPLHPNTAYKLYLESNAGHIEHDFKTPAALPMPR